MLVNVSAKTLFYSVTYQV